MRKMLVGLAVIAAVNTAAVSAASVSDKSLGQRLTSAATTYNRDAAGLRRAKGQASSGGAAALSAAAARLHADMQHALASVRADRASSLRGLSARSLAIQGLLSLVASADYELRFADAVKSNAPSSTRQALAATASARARAGVAVLGRARVMLG